MSATDCVTLIGAPWVPPQLSCVVSAANGEHDSGAAQSAVMSTAALSMRTVDRRMCSRLPKCQLLALEQVGQHCGAHHAVDLLDGLSEGRRLEAGVNHAVHHAVQIPPVAKIPSPDGWRVSGDVAGGSEHGLRGVTSPAAAALNVERVWAAPVCLAGSMQYLSGHCRHFAKAIWSRRRVHHWFRINSVADQGCAFRTCIALKRDV